MPGSYSPDIKRALIMFLVRATEQVHTLGSIISYMRGLFGALSLFEPVSVPENL